ncbi:MAG: DUF4160 domain-containing protein [Betaproteobacteria bacterium]|nr:DUF4160 domain-containing protein [Betaproteobacteria bacterium]
MGKVYSGNSWLIRVQGNEHTPVHVHVICPEGKAAVYLDGLVINSGVPAATLKRAEDWIARHHCLIRQEWIRMNNPATRGES